MRNLFLLAIIILFITSKSANTQNPSWIVSTDTIGAEHCSSMIIDKCNNIYIAAQGENSITLLKYDSYGSVQYAESDNIDGTHGNMCQGNNDNLYLAGSRRFELYNGDASIVVYNSDGTHLYTLSYDFMGMYDIFKDIYVDSNNYIYVCGDGFTELYDRYGIVARYKPNGSLDWIQTYGFPQHDIKLDFLNVDSNGFIYASGVNSNELDGDMEIVSLKYTFDGQLVQEFSSAFNGYSGYDPRFSLVDNDGCIFIGGKVHDENDQIAFLIKIQNGLLKWSQIFPDWHGVSYLSDATFNHNMNIICCGSFTSTECDAYLVEISSNGDVIAETHYSNIPNQAETFNSIVENNGYFYCCGLVEWQGIVTVAVFDSEFDLVWQTNYDSPILGYDKADLIAVDYESNILVSGYTARSKHSCLILKYSNPVGIDDLAGSEIHPIEVFPNPAESLINFQLDVETDDTRYIISNTSGQIVQSGYLDGILQQQIELSALHAGIYFVQILDGKKQYIAKFVKN